MQFPGDPPNRQPLCNSVASHRAARLPPPCSSPPPSKLSLASPHRVRTTSCSLSAVFDYFCSSTSIQPNKFRVCVFDAVPQCNAVQFRFQSPVEGLVVLSSLNIWCALLFSHFCCWWMSILGCSQFARAIEELICCLEAAHVFLKWRQHVFTRGAAPNQFSPISRKKKVSLFLSSLCF